MNSGHPNLCAPNSGPSEIGFRQLHDMICVEMEAIQGDHPSTPLLTASPHFWILMDLIMSQIGFYLFILDKLPVQLRAMSDGRR